MKQILRKLTGQELLMMRVLYGRAVIGPVDAELDRRARSGMGPTRRLPVTALRLQDYMTAAPSRRAA